jgi:hypothetical protein
MKADMQGRRKLSDTLSKLAKELVLLHTADR